MAWAACRRSARFARLGRANFLPQTHCHRQLEPTSAAGCARVQSRRCASSGVPAVRRLRAHCVVEAQNELGESPVWCERSSTLYWVDCLKRELWAYRPERQRLVTPGGVRLSADVCNTIGSIGLAEGGGLVMASDCGLHLLPELHMLQHMPPALMPPTVFLGHPLRAEGLAGPEHAALRLNDGRVDRQGRFVVGAYHSEHGSFVGADGSVSPDMPRGRVYRLGRFGATEVLSSVSPDGVRVANGTAFSPDGRTMYFVDSPTREVHALPYTDANLGAAPLCHEDPDTLGLGVAQLREALAALGIEIEYRLVHEPRSRYREELVAMLRTAREEQGSADAPARGQKAVSQPVTRREEHEANPDGGTVDSEGGYWSAEYGSARVVRWVDRKIDCVVELPVPNVTSCTFGGDDLDTLFITTATRKDPSPEANGAGGLFAVKPGFRGVPEAYYVP